MSAMPAFPIKADIAELDLDVRDVSKIAVQGCDLDRDRPVSTDKS